jgi:hypothetical protein
LKRKLDEIEIAYDHLEIVKSTEMEKSDLEFLEVEKRVDAIKSTVQGLKMSRAEYVKKFEEE